MFGYQHRRSREWFPTNLSQIILPAASVLLALLVAPAAANADPPSDDFDEIGMVFRGAVAPQLAASTLISLIQHYPKLALDPEKNSDSIKSVEGVCGAQEDNNALPGCVFWDKLIATGAWPRGVPQLDIIPAALRTGLNQYRLPAVRVSVLESLQQVSYESSVPHDEELSEKERLGICRRQRWSERDGGDCIIAMVAPEDVGAESAKTRTVIIKQRVLRLSLRVPIETAATMRAYLRQLVRNPHPNGSSVVVEQPARAVKALYQPAAAPFCGANILRSALARAKKAISWPAGASSPLPAGRLLVLDAGEKWFATDRMYAKVSAVDGSAWSADAVAYAQHPMFRAAPPWGLACDKISIVAASGPAHGFAVASVIAGQPAALDLLDASSVRLEPFFGAGDPVIGRIALIDPAKLGVPLGTQVVIAAYQQAAPAPAVALPSSEKPKVQHFAATVATLMSAGFVVVASAPEIENGISTETDDDSSDNFLCRYYPSCLGSTGWMLTVAPLNADGALMTTNPVNGAQYDITPRTVAVAAAGQDIPVITTSEAGPSLGFATGSSLAAPAVGAIALELRLLSADIGAYEAISAIQSTADLSRNFQGKLRFGVTNAARAFSIARTSPGSALIFNATSNESADAAQSVSAMKVIGQPRDARCDVSDEDAAMGVLAYFDDSPPVVEPDGTIVPPNCIGVRRLLRLRWVGQKGAPGQPGFSNLYDIVFHTFKKSPKRQYAQIVRNVALSPPDGGSGRCMPDLGSGQLGQQDGACLLIQAADGVLTPVGLIRRDLVFNPLNRLQHR